LRLYFQAAFSIALLLAVDVPQYANVARAETPATAITLTPNKIDFGTQPVGVASQPQTSTLTNIGKARVAIDDITVSGIDFSEASTCPEQLAPGAECSISVTFKPAINEPRFGTVIISDSAAGSPHMLLLSGVGQ